MFKNVGQYSKFVVAVLGAVGVGVTTFGHNAPWVATVLAVVSAVATYLVPNTTPATLVAKESGKPAS